MELVQEAMVSAANMAENSERNDGTHRSLTTAHGYTLVYTYVYTHDYGHVCMKNYIYVYTYVRTCLSHVRMGAHMAAHMCASMSKHANIDWEG